MNNAATLPDDSAPSGLYPIRAVSSLTGVNAVTLRAWERRYGLITPHRTEKGHRLYTRADIDRINRIVELINSGISISQVEQHLLEDGRPQADANDAWLAYQTQMLSAITRFDEPSMDAAYNEALSLYPVDVVTERLINPLLRQLGERWQKQSGAIAEEHFFGTYMRNKLGARLHHLAMRNARPKLVAACLPGEYHELGLLLFCLAASAYGYGFIILGANTPLAELAHAVARSHSDGVLLSGSIPDNESVTGSALRKLVAQLEVPVFVGGQTAVAQHDAVRRAGALPLGSDTASAIRHLNAHFESNTQA